MGVLISKRRSATPRPPSRDRKILGSILTGTAIRTYACGGCRDTGQMNGETCTACQ